MGHGDEAMSDKYTEDQMPCIVARKACGCYIAVTSLRATAFTREPDVITRRSIREALDFMCEITNSGEEIVYELRPISFVRNGGLNLECNCVPAAGSVENTEVER
jgi:hypothetical protein